jgi:hypothetical protein
MVEGTVDNHEVCVSGREDGEERLRYSLPDPIRKSHESHSSGCVRRCSEPLSARGGVDRVPVREVVHPVQILVDEGGENGCGGLALQHLDDEVVVVPRSFVFVSGPMMYTAPSACWAYWTMSPGSPAAAYRRMAADEPYCVIYHSGRKWSILFGVESLTAQTFEG